jgi:hypothetical protein
MIDMKRRFQTAFAMAFAFASLALSASLADPSEAQAAFVSLSDAASLVVPSAVRQGDPIPVFLASGGKLELCSVLLANAEGVKVTDANAFAYPLDGYKGSVAAMIGVWSTQKPGTYSLTVKWTEDGRPGEATLPIVVGEREFTSFDLKATAAMTKLRSEPDKQKELESKILYDLWYKEDLASVYLDTTFIVPVDNPRITTEFGERIRYIYTDGSVTSNAHMGIDYGAPIGTPVKAAAKGKIVMAVMRIMTGNTVLIEHLPGMYSLYYHLDSISVKEGDIVRQGQLIGTVGTTGFSTGSHLHWDVRIRGVSVDPMAFVAGHPLDKQSLSRRLSRASSEGR